MHGYGKNFWQSGSKNSGDRYEGYWEDDHVMERVHIITVMVYNLVVNG